MTTPNTNTPAPAPAPAATVAETVMVNGLTVQLQRTETERVKEGREATIYWSVPLAQFHVMNTTKSKDPSGKDVENVTLNEVETLKQFVKLFSAFETLEDKLQAKINGDCKAAQLDAGKDKFTMDRKLANVKAYITESKFGASRVVRKSEIDLAQENFNGEIALLRAKLASKSISEADYKSSVAKLVAEHTANISRIVQASIAASIGS